MLMVKAVYFSHFIVRLLNVSRRVKRRWTIKFAGHRHSWCVIYTTDQSKRREWREYKQSLLAFQNFRSLKWLVVDKHKQCLISDVFESIWTQSECSVYVVGIHIVYVFRNLPKMRNISNSDAFFRVVWSLFFGRHSSQAYDCNLELSPPHHSYSIPTLFLHLLNVFFVALSWALVNIWRNSFMKKSTNKSKCGVCVCICVKCETFRRFLPFIKLSHALKSNYKMFAKRCFSI